MNYEINFLILQSQTENTDEIKTRVKKLITDQEGKITDELIYQKRKLAYEIKHEQYGFYTVYRFDLESGEKLKDLTKNLNLEKGVSRYIIVKSTELPKLQKEIGKEPKSEEKREVTKKPSKKKSEKKILAEIKEETKKQVPKTKVDKNINKKITKNITTEKEKIPLKKKKKEKKKDKN